MDDCFQARNGFQVRIDVIAGFHGHKYTLMLGKPFAGDDDFLKKHPAGADQLLVEQGVCTEIKTKEKGQDDQVDN